MRAHYQNSNGANDTGKAPSAEDKAVFLAEAESWIQASEPQRISRAVKRQTLRGLDRLHAHQRALIEGLARYYRANLRADVAPGLFALIVILSDNDEHGACYLQVARIAEVLGRTPDSIREARARLIKAGVIGMEERGGASNLYWPLVPQCFVGDVSVHWLIEHYSPQPKQKGRPEKPLPLEGGPFSSKPSPVEGEPFPEKPSPSNRRGFRKTLPPRSRKPFPLVLETT